MEDVKERITSFLSKYFRAQDLKDDDDIFALGFVNSLFATQLIMWVENEFNIKVEDEDIDINNFNTKNAITSFIQRKMLE